MTSLDDEEKLEPMPPLPSPRVPPDAPSLRTKSQRQSFRLDLSSADEILTPESPPNPHTHPLQALSDESARTIKQQQNKGGMAISSSPTLFHRRPIVLGERLDSTFLRRERVQAFTKREKEDLPQESDNPFAVETEHGSRAIALQLQLQQKEMEQMPPIVPLDEQERVLAATEASSKRHELLQMKNEDKWDEEKKDNDETALARASERKVRKQVDPKWIQSRQDPCNRPKRPLERPEERELRETLIRTTASDIVRSGVLNDETDGARFATFDLKKASSWSVISSGFIGLPGCCFETYGLDH